MRITKKAMDGLIKADKDAFYWDDDLAGFGVKVTPAGKKVFVLQTRLHGRPKRYTIGTYGQPWSPDNARLEAKKMLGQVSAGIDPHEEKKSRRQDITISELADLYWEAAKAHKKPTTIANEKGLQKRHIIPLLGKSRLRDLQKHHIQKFVNDVAAGKTVADIRTKPRGRARVTGGQGSANRTFGLLSSMLSFAVERGLRPDNPALGVKQFKLRKHDRYLSAEELEKLGQALKSVEVDCASPFAIAAIRFLALSGCRRNEALSLQWGWLDLEHNLAKLPDSKTGQKVLLLGKVALEFLKMLPRVEGSPLVFPSAAGGTTPLSIQKIWDKVREKAGLEDIRLHDLRHNFASTAVSSGQSLYIVGKLLGHSQSQTTQRYAHLAPDPVRAAADEVASGIAQKLK
ncbi:site-specific integrase [Sinorhizobium sp. M4_45]|uniref:tyrosine-type recombinase/integrase n=1 Tax=Sinorhizobium sp. M4_45 TaxID=2037901 RepID=UPI0015E15378|nr:site-specific integrase [Sinorhizobium sp. M4_45]